MGNLRGACHLILTSGTGWIYNQLVEGAQGSSGLSAEALGSQED